MGMGYKYAGSASYPRFDTELSNIAKIFGGMLTSDAKKLVADITPENDFIRYMFGPLSGDDTVGDKFVFPKGTPAVLVKWFNHIYSEDFTPEETNEIWTLFRQHPEIEEISRQIWYELEQLAELCESWYIT